MKKSVIIGILLVLALHFPAAAEFYRYKDTHGNTIYTDDYSKVPPEQREEAKSYDEYIPRPQTDSGESPADITEKESEIEEDANNEGRRLKQREKALTQEYNGLTAEREALDKEKKAAITKPQIKVYNKKVVEFNARIKAYQEKRDAHTIEVQKFNQRKAEQESDNPSQ